MTRSVVRAAVHCVYSTRMSGEIKYSQPKICTWKKWRPASEWTRIEFIFALGGNGNPDVSGRKKWEAYDG